MSTAKQDYLPAAGSDWLLWIYDPLLRVTGAHRLYREFLDRVPVSAETRVMDIGCGTGSLAIMLQRRQPQAQITGVDPDPKALSRARRKAQRSGGVAIRFEQGYAQSLPAADGTFDRVLSSFMAHHLPLETKRCMMHEAYRVLAPGGEFHLVDFMPESDRKDTFLAKLLHSDEDLRNNTSEQLGVLLGEAGFSEVRDLGGRKSLFGRVGSFVAVR